MAFRSNIFLALSLLLSIYFNLSATAAEFNSYDDAKFRSFLEQYKADPGLLRKQPEIIKSLNGQQLATAIESLELDHYGYLHPVVIKGAELPTLLGHPLDQISIASVRSGKLTIVSSQIDELDKNGWVYIKEKSAADIDGAENSLDANDELVFMYRDTGTEPYDQASMPTPTSGTIHSELAFTDANGLKRFAYVMLGAATSEVTDYVDFDLAAGQADTTFYNFKVDPKNVLDFQDFKANVGDWQDHRILDAVLFQINSGVFTKWTTINLNNFDNFKAIPIGVKDGNIRAAVLLEIWVKYGGIPLMRIFGQLNIYDQSLGIPLSIQIPAGEILAKTLVNPEIEFILDFNNYQGARVSAAGVSPEKFGIVDGKMSDMEKAATLSRDEPWLWMESGHGWDIFATCVLPEDWNAKLNISYEDSSRKLPNETFPGAYPRAGFNISELPKDALNIVLNIDMRFPDTVGSKGPHEFAKLVAKPPTVEIKTMAE